MESKINRIEDVPVLNIEEIKEEKYLLANKIHDLIFDYQNKTKTKIEKVDILENIENGFNSKNTFYINIKTTY
jgi:hypothetical protein